MKKWIWIALGSLMFCVIGAGLFAVSRLPSRSEIVSAVTQEKTSIDTEAPVPNSAGSPTVAKVENAIASSSEENAKKDKRKKELKRILTLMNEDPRDIRVCDHLGQSKVDPKKKHFEFDDILSDERNDSLTEAYRAPLKAIFQEPHVTELFQELFALDPELEGKSKAEKDGIFEKIGFYSRVAKVGLALRSQKEYFENLGDRAVHLGVLAKIALLKPEMKNSTALVDYCRVIENPENVTTRAALADERKKILDLILESGLKPADLDFDPKNWVRFSVETGKDGLKVSLQGNDFDRLEDSSSKK